jgi:uncharacterized protein (TIGR03790 family)
VQTTTEYEMTQADFRSQLRRPIAKALKDRQIAGRARCIVLMWGVPVRMGDDARYAWRRIRRRTHTNLVINTQLLTSVAKRFPEPRTDGLAPIGSLFAARVSEPPEPMPGVAELRKTLDALLTARQEQLPKIDDAKKRAIAARQIAAMHLDLYGLSGLLDYVGKHKAPAAPDAATLRKRLAEAKKALAEALEKEKEDASSVDPQKLAELWRTTGGLFELYKEAARRHNTFKKKPADASVDSELALLWWPDYPDRGFLPNPLNWRMQKRMRGRKSPPVLMTARIDGPTKADAMKIVKASLSAEKTGLEGTVYIDAGGPNRARQYDKHLTDLHAWLRKTTDMKVVLDTKPTVLRRGSAPDAALYVGWYSLRKYVPAFIWKTGSVGWHIASFEAMHLRDPKTQEWVPKMIQNGVAGTLGAVNEPYLGAFPLPEDFFPLLLTGKYTLAEVYWRTCPMVSWRMTLVGDPLYNPYARNPKVQLKDLPAGLAPQQN